VKALARFARWYGLLGPAGGFLWMPDPAQGGFVRTKPSSSRLLLRSLYEALSPEQMAELVRQVLANDPGLLSRRVNGESLLHLAVLDGAPVEVLQLLAMTPNVAEFRVRGKTPLHIACIKQLPAPSIELLVNLCHAALMIKDRNGRLPIHWACSPWKGWNEPSATIEILVDANPLTLKEKDRRGRLPLEFIFSRETEPHPAFVKAIMRMVDAYPDALLESRRFIFSQHSTCRWLCNWKAKTSPDTIRRIQRMIEDVGSTLRMRDGKGETPIKSAIHQLLDADLSTLKVRDRVGRLPLHWVACGPPSRAIQSMIDDYPDALLARDDAGRTPLSCACSLLSPNCGMIQMLLDANPLALEVSDRHGALPLHLACRRSTELNVIARLIDAYPDALLARRDDGQTPLHCACLAESCEAIQLLLDANPSTLNVSDRNGELPLHIACRALRDGPGLLSVIRLTESCKTNPSAEKFLGSIDWLNPYRCGLMRRGPPGLDVIKRMVDAYPDALRERNRWGGTPVMAAIREILQETTVVPHVLVEMIQRGGSESVRGRVVWGLSRDATTALNRTLEYSLDRTLVSALIEAWPCALCLPLPRWRLGSNDMELEELLSRESNAVIEALVEVLLHETTVGAVPNPIRESVRQLVASQPGSRPVTRAIQDLFGGDLEAAFFESREDIQDMIASVYRMNKAGRAPSAGCGAPVATFPTQHIQVLAAAADNPSCLFFYLRDAACHSLFAGNRGAATPSPAKAELPLRSPP
jgi:ankyrin repeat protein